jgi:type III restriction enzyme
LKHHEKELRYLDKGIKVLSLFFIDDVGKYRTTEGFKGIYAKMFEECYKELIMLPKFADLHGEFLIIMKDKEWLLSFDCPLRFILSHSALKEGWNKPNVF